MNIFKTSAIPGSEKKPYSSIEFMDLFTSAEEAAIRILARSTNPDELQASVQMEAFLARVVAATVIYLDDARVVAGILALRSLNILATDARRDEILAGSAPQ